MDHFAGLDVSVKETSLCIVDDAGRIVREVKVASEPEALLAVLTNPACHFKRIGLEAGPLSQWLFKALAEARINLIAVSASEIKVSALMTEDQMETAVRVLHTAFGLDSRPEEKAAGAAA